MISIPIKVFKASIRPGNIYLLRKHKLKNSSEPHLFITVALNDEEVALFSCCTTQFEKRKRHIELAGLPTSTLVTIKPDSSNKLNKTTHIDCNGVIPYTIEELHTLSEEGNMNYIGLLKDGKLEEIKAGINDSPNVEGEYKDMVSMNGKKE